MDELSLALGCALIASLTPELCLHKVQKYTRCDIGNVAFQLPVGHRFCMPSGLPPQMADNLGWLSWERRYMLCPHHVKVITHSLGEMNKYRIISSMACLLSGRHFCQIHGTALPHSYSLQIVQSGPFRQIHSQMYFPKHHNYHYK